MRREILVILMMLTAIPLCFIGDVNAETENFCNWKQFNEDYKDTDDDGKKDDYESFIVGESIHIFDKMIDYTEIVSLGYTIITLDSFPDEKVYFWNTLNSSVQKDKGIMMSLKITSDEEADGDPCEYYIVDSITLTFNEDDSDHSASVSSENSSMNWAVFAFCCGPGIVIPIIVWIIVQLKSKE